MPAEAATLSRVDLLDSGNIFSSDSRVFLL